MRLGLHLVPRLRQRFLFRAKAVRLLALASQIVSGALQGLLQVVHVLLTQFEFTRQFVELRLAGGALLLALLDPPLTSVRLAAVGGLFTLHGGLDLLQLLPLLLDRLVAGAQFLVDPGHDVGPGLHLLLNSADGGAEILTESKNLGGCRVCLGCRFPLSHVTFPTVRPPARTTASARRGRSGRTFPQLATYNKTR